MVSFWGNNNGAQLIPISFPLSLREIRPTPPVTPALLAGQRNINLPLPPHDWPDLDATGRRRDSPKLEAPASGRTRTAVTDRRSRHCFDGFRHADRAAHADAAIATSFGNAGG